MSSIPAVGSTVEEVTAAEGLGEGAATEESSAEGLGEEWAD